MGESGQPCLSPRVAWKNLAGCPLISGAIHGTEMQALIQPINFWENPNFRKTVNRKSCRTRSKALARSNLITISFSFFLQLVCMASWTRMMLSRICRPLTNPPWFFGISFGRTFLSLLAIILVIILYPVLQRDIGLKRLKVFAPFSFGMRDKKEELVLPPNLLQF